MGHVDTARPPQPRGPHRPSLILTAANQRQGARRTCPVRRAAQHPHKQQPLLRAFSQTIPARSWGSLPESPHGIGGRGLYHALGLLSAGPSAMCEAKPWALVRECGHVCAARALPTSVLTGPQDARVLAVMSALAQPGHATLRPPGCSACPGDASWATCQSHVLPPCASWGPEGPSGCLCASPRLWGARGTGAAVCLDASLGHWPYLPRPPGCGPRGPTGLF